MIPTRIFRSNITPSRRKEKENANAEQEGRKKRSQEKMQRKCSELPLLLFSFLLLSFLPAFLLLSLLFLVSYSL
jgi:hypothetical protein